MSTEKDYLEEEILSIEAEIEKELPGDVVKVLKRLAYEIAIVGLDEQEACLIMNFDFTRLQALKEQYPKVKKLFDVKNLTYKRGLIRTLSIKARQGDDKLAQWLLEAKYPGEYNRRKGVGKGGDDGDGNILGAAIEFIQKQTSSDGLVNERSGRAFLVKGNVAKDSLVKSDRPDLVGEAEKMVEKINAKDI